MATLLRSALCAAALVAATGSAHAQLAAYANFEGDRFGQTGDWVKGGTFGIYDDFISLGPLKLGADARGSHLTGDRISVNKVLVGLRAAVKPPLLPIKPYAELLGGAVKADAGTLTGNYHVTYQVNGGVDFTFFPHLDWRVIEVGGDSFGDEIKKNIHVSTGLVVRFF